jgi:hypothetical protein
MEPGDSLAWDGLLAFKDRRTGLMIYGIFEIIAGALCAVFIPLMFLGQALNQARTGTPPQYRLMFPGLMVYAMLAVLLVVLGIGSIRARRWARAFGLILGWSWLLTGSIGLIVYAFVLPKLLATVSVGGPAIPPGAKLVILVVGLAFSAVLMVLIPLAVVLFYRSPHVRATCQARDPAVRWTDKRPLPVLGLSLWLAAGGVFMLLMPLAYSGAAPFFGVLLSGIAGSIFYLFMAICFGFLARGIYRLDPVAWWLVLAVSVLAGVSNVMTFARIDPRELYRFMGYSQAQLQQLQGLNLLNNDLMACLSAIGILPMLAYLMYLRRFFRGSSRTPGLVEK